MKKRQKSAWVLLFTLLFWWQVSPVGAIEKWSGLSETSAPVIITQLNQSAASAPQVYIASPRSEEVIADTTVAVQLQVVGTPIFKNSQLGLGPHLHLLLDRVPTESIYNLSTPITLSNLSPGTHTLQVLANKPWHESWKNPQAFAQVTFHVLAKSADSPNVQTPQLISVQPTAIGAEPWLLDFYVANAPSHVDAQYPLRQIADWRVRVTVNEQSFEVNRDEPIYLRGLRLGVNVLKLEYLNAQGQVADSVVRVVRYQPNGNDGLSRLVRNELSIDQALTLFDPQSQFSGMSSNLPGMYGNSGMPSNPPGMYGNSGMPSNPPGMYGNSGMPSNPSGMYGNSGMQSNPPGMYGNSGMQSNPPGMYGNSGMPSNPPGMYGNSGMQSNPPGMYGNSGMQSNPPGMYGNSGMPSNPPGMYGNSGMPSNPPRMYGNSGTQWNPSEMYGNSGTQWNPSEMYGNSGVPSNPPEMYGNSGNLPRMYGNSGTQWNPEMQRNSINPVSPQSILPAPSRTLSNSAEISQLKLPQTIAGGASKSIAFGASEAIGSLPPINQEQKEIAAIPQNRSPNVSSKDIALLPPVQPPPISPNARLGTEANEPIAALAPKPIAESADEAIAPPITKQPAKTTVAPTSRVLPNPSNDKIVSDTSEAITPPVPKAIAEADPNPLPSTTSEKVVDFKAIGQQLLHTTSVKIKHFTNQIPPLASSWSEKFRHWLSDRMAAMRANPSPTTLVESAQPVLVRE